MEAAGPLSMFTVGIDGLKSFSDKHILFYTSDLPNVNSKSCELIEHLYSNTFSRIRISIQCYYSDI